MNLKDILNRAKFEVIPDKEDMRQKIFLAAEAEQKKPPVRRWIYRTVGLAAALALLVGFGYFTFQYYKFDRSVNINGDIAALSQVVYAAPRNVTDSGVSTNTSVDIVTKEHISLKALEKCISVTPEVSYTIHKKGVNRFSMTFDEPLEKDTSYTVNSVSSGDIVYRWSLQTEKSFAITNVYPSSDDFYCDVDTGIEVTFSESDVGDFQDYFSIEPAVAGTFHHNGRTWIFSPEKNLSPYTTYTVTVDGDIAGSEEKPLGSDYVFSFTTGASDEKYAFVVNNGHDIADTFLSGESPMVKITAKGNFAGTADITVYRIPDTESYIQLHQKYDGDAIISGTIAKDIAEKGFSVYSKFSASARQYASEEKDTYYFQYPKELDRGYYITEIVWSGARLYQFVQSTDLSVYAALIGNDCTVWVNNTQSKLPAGKATVSIDDAQTAQTDANGLAEFQEVSETERQHLIKIDFAGEPTFVTFLPKHSDVQRVDYYSYLYTDSSVYRPTDTVNIWGCVRVRNQGASLSGLKIHADWNDTDYPITPDENGAFSVQIPLQNNRTDSSSVVTLSAGGTELIQKEIQIAEYDLPTYTLTASTDKNAYIAGTAMTANVQAAYYDGTPAANLKITNYELGSAVTDGNGTARLNVAATSYTEETLAENTVMNTTLPYFKQIDWQCDTALEQYFSTTDTAVIFYNTEFISTTLTPKENDGFSLDIKTRKVDLTKLNSMSKAEVQALYGEIPEALYDGGAVDKSLSVEVHHVTYDREKTGSSYDYVSKKVINNYTYTEKDTISKTYNVSTVGGNAILNDLSLPNGDGYYYLRVAMKDSSGKNAYVNLYCADAPGQGVGDYTLNVDKNTAVVGDKITLNIKKGGAQTAVREGSFVYLLANDRIIDTEYQNTPTGSFTFREENMPDTDIYGAYFDGAHVYALEYHTVVLDTTSKKLTLSIKPDQKSYQPGDTVQLTLSIKDPSGKPVSASFNINVADQALLDTYQNDHDIVNALYGGISDFTQADTFASYRSFADNGGGEGGGQGDARRDFEDTPAFLTGKTNADGTASLSFTLSDRVTKWAIIAQAIDANGQAGDTTETVTATSDFFISADQTKTIKSTDDAVISLRCDGTAASGNVTTKITLSRADKTVKELQKEHGAKALVYFNFGKLEKGTYTVKIASKNAAAQDALSYSLTVADSTLSVNLISQDLTNAADGGTLLLMDEKRSALTETIQRLARYSSTRLDHRIGAAVAQSYAEYTGAAFENTDWSFLNDYMAYGFMAYKTDETADLGFTARICALIGDNINTDTMGQYFDSILADPETTFNEALCALWGKASLHSAVEKDLDYYYAEGNAFTAEQQLLFALGYAYGGNQSKANEIYQQKIKPLLQHKGDEWYLPADEAELLSRQNEYLALLALRISAAESEGILLYNRNNNKNLSAFADIAYLKEYVPLLEGKNTAQITYADGSKQTVEYDRHALMTVKLPDAAGKITVTDIQGTTAAYIRQAQPVSTLFRQGAKSGELAVTLPETVVLGEAVTLTLSPNQGGNPGGCIQLALPAGLHFAGIENGGCLQSPDKSKLTVYAAQNQGAVTVHLQTVMPGSFTIEPMILVTDGEHYLSSPAKSITITEKAQ